MFNPFSLFLFIGGIALLFFGISASESVSSSFSKFFTGEPSDRSIWLMLGGIAALLVGGALSWREARR